MAIEAHPRVLGAQAAETTAVENIGVERARYFPSFDLAVGGGWERTDTPGTRARNGPLNIENDPVNVAPRSDATISVEQMVFDGWQTLGRTRSAEHGAKAAGHDVDFAGEEIAIRVVDAYLEVLRNRERVMLAEANLAAHRGVLKDVTEKAETGAGSQVDVFQAEARTALSNTRLREEQSNLRNSEADYVEAVGEMPGELELPDPPADAIPASVDDALNDAVENSPELLSANSVSRSRKEDVNALKWPFWPRFDIVASHTYEKDDDPTNRGVSSQSRAQLRMTYNLYRGGEDRSRLNRAVERLGQTVHRAAEVRRLLEEQMRVDYNELNVARDQLPALEGRVMATDNTLGGYREQFDLGLRSLLDVLDVQNELLTASNALVDGEFRYRGAHYQILSTAGMLLKTLGVPVVAPKAKLPEPIFDQLSGPTY